MAGDLPYPESAVIPMPSLDILNIIRDGWVAVEEAVHPLHRCSVGLPVGVDKPLTGSGALVGKKVLIIISTTTDPIPQMRNPFQFGGVDIPGVTGGLFEKKLRVYTLFHRIQERIKTTTIILM